MSKGTKETTAKKSNALLNTIVVLIIAAFLAAGVYATYGKVAESIKDKAIESGEKEATVEYLAKQEGMSIEDYLAQYGLELNDTITKDTTQTDMLDNMTLENYLKYNGGTQTVDEVLEGTHLTDKATKDTLWKDFMPMVPVVSILGEDSFNQIKEQLGLGDEVTEDMPYGDFEKLVEEKTKSSEDENTDSAEEDGAEEDGGEAEGTQEAAAE